MQKKIKIFFINLLVTFLLLEITAAVAIRCFNITTVPVIKKVKDYRVVDIDAVFGPWHLPNTEVIQKETCFEVINSFNSYGARDREREIDGAENRIINIGDSFVEGFGVDTVHRLSNLLERKLGKEVLNFGTSGGIGSTQLRLQYESMVSKFSHESLLISLFPFNDFNDDDIEYGKIMYPDRYKPYLVKNTNNDYEINYIQDDIKKSSWHPESLKNKKIGFKDVIEMFHFGKIVLHLKIQLFHSKEALAKNQNPFEVFEQKGLDILTYNLLKIRENAINKKIFIFAIPSYGEMKKRFENPNLDDKLGRSLKTICTENDMIYIDLYRILTEKYTIDNFENLFLSCDGHWSAEGHQAASDILYSFLKN